MPVGVDTGGDEGVDLDHPGALTDPYRQRVGGQERVRAGVEWSGAEGLDLLVELGGHHTHLRFAQPGDPEGPGLRGNNRFIPAATASASCGEGL
jgi:hypothetical protein